MVLGTHIHQYVGYKAHIRASQTKHLNKH